MRLAVVLILRMADAGFFIRLHSRNLCIGVTTVFRHPRPGMHVRLEQCDFGGPDSIVPSHISLDQEFEARPREDGRFALSLTNYPALCLQPSKHFIQVQPCNNKNDAQEWKLQQHDDPAQFSIEGLRGSCLATATTPNRQGTLLRGRTCAASQIRFDLLQQSSTCGTTPSSIQPMTSINALLDEENERGYSLITVVACALSCALVATTITSRLLMRYQQTGVLQPTHKLGMPATQAPLTVFTTPVLPVAEIVRETHWEKVPLAVTATNPCPVCLCVVQDSVELSCSHRICKSCSAKCCEAGHQSCPVCRHPHLLDPKRLKDRSQAWREKYGSWRAGQLEGAVGEFCSIYTPKGVMESPHIKNIVTSPLAGDLIPLQLSGDKLATGGERKLCQHKE